MAAEALNADPAGAAKPHHALWRELPPAEMAAHLIGTPTIADRAWTDKPRLPRETRIEFINKILLSKSAPAET